MEKITELESQLMERKILDNDYLFAYFRGKDTKAISLLCLQDKINAVIEYLNLEYKHFKEHYKLVKKEGESK